MDFKFPSTRQRSYSDVVLYWNQKSSRITIRINRAHDFRPWRGPIRPVPQQLRLEVRTRSSSEHHRRLRTRPRLVSRIPPVSGHLVRICHSSNNRSLRPQHYGCGRSQGLEKGVTGQDNARARNPATASDRRLREGIRRGEITCSVRIWTRPHVRVGARYRMDYGMRGRQL
jgi:hypothetical protein